MAVLVRMHLHPREPWASNQKWGVARCTFLCSSFSKLPTFYFCSDLHWTLVHLLKVVEKTQKICSVSRILGFWTWITFSNFAQWRYTNQWPFREVVLLLVENWIPIPRLRDVKYHLSCQFLTVLLQTNWSCTNILTCVNQEWKCEPKWIFRVNSDEFRTFFGPRNKFHQGIESTHTLYLFVEPSF